MEIWCFCGAEQSIPNNDQRETAAALKSATRGLPTQLDQGVDCIKMSHLLIHGGKDSTGELHEEHIYIHDRTGPEIREEGLGVGEPEECGQEGGAEEVQGGGQEGGG